MSTPYTSVYGYFLAKVSNYDYISLSDTDLDTALHSLLVPATTDFIDCTNDLTLDDTLSQFDSTLTSLEQNILALYMLKNWLMPEIYKTSLIRQNMTDKDFQVSSSANMLNSLMRLKNDLETEINYLVSRYTYLDTLGIQQLVTTEGYPIVTDLGALYWSGNGNVGQQV